MLLMQEDPRLKRKRELAQSMMNQGMTQGPIRHWTQGANRLAQSLLGAYMDKKAAGEQDKLSSEGRKALASVLAGGGDIDEKLGQLSSVPNINQDFVAQMQLQRGMQPKQRDPIADHRAKKEIDLEMAQQEDALDPGAGFSDEMKLRKEFTSLTADFNKQQQAFGRVLASSKNPSPAGDLALIFNYMKILDPGSVVRESEFATAAASGSYGERLKAAGQKILSGERLSDEMRADFVGRSAALYEEAAKGFDASSERYRGLAEDYEADPSRIVPEGRLYAPEAYQDLVNLQPDTVAQPTTEEEYNALPSGAVYIDPDDGKRYRKP